MRPGGEFALIERLLAHVPSGSGVLVGPGDDAAVVTGAARMLVTTDMLVEGRHFDLALSSPADVGYKALMVNASDVAAMGGVPRYAVVAAGVPDAGEAAEQLAEGLGEAARELDVGIVGGDTVAAPQVVISIALLGEPGERIVTRAGARPGDALCVTGELGAAAAAVRAWKSGGTPEPAARLAFALPTPRIAEAIWLATRRVVDALIDISDGLAGDVEHLAAASEVRIIIDAASVPIHPTVHAHARDHDHALRLALTGGEDYELCFAAPPGSVERIADAFMDTFDVQLTCVGTIHSGAGVMLRSNGAVSELPYSGHDHFTAAP